MDLLFKRLVTCSNISAEKLDNHSSDLSALFINIKWKLSLLDNGKTIEDLVIHFDI